MPKFGLLDFPYAANKLLMSRFRDSANATVLDLPLGEPVPGHYGAIGSASSGSSTFTVEVRKVLDLTSAGFDAATSSATVFGPDTYVPIPDTVDGSGGGGLSPAGQTTFTFDWIVDGVLTDATSVALQDPTNTYGVRARGTTIPVVASGTPMVHTGTGTYSYGPITDSASGLVYEWYARVTDTDGAVYPIPMVTNGSLSGVPVSRYVNWRDFVNDFGLQNIVTAANKDATMYTPTGAHSIPRGQPNYYAVQNALDYATDEIHSTLYGGVLKIPLDFTPNGGKVPARVSSWAKIIAFCRLLGMRAPNRSLPGRRGVAPTGPDYATMLESAYLEMGSHKYGQWAQMPEAVQAFDGTPVVARNFYSGTSTAVRFMDGQWQFGSFMTTVGQQQPG